MTHRALVGALRGAAVATLVLVSAGVSVKFGIAAEGQSSVSREDLIAAVERGPGPTKGAADAPVVMVEFSDFQCGYCRLFWRETLPKIEDQYIRAGKVRFVYRHMAIQGEASVLAAQAASCAHDQGKFWQYHDTLFSQGSPLAFTSARLKRYAAELRLDEKTFTACLDSGKHAERVEAETILGHALGANGTPAFLLNGRLAIGAYPFGAFQRGLNTLLTATPQGPSEPAK
ncbi:MAG: DsbA family protein [Candidatus Methylomirabilales bacterium]